MTDAEDKRVALDHLPAIYELVKDLHIIADRQASHGFLFTPSILRAAALRLSQLERENARLREALFETHLDLVAYADIEVARKRLVERRAALAGGGE